MLSRCTQMELGLRALNIRRRPVVLQDIVKNNLEFFENSTPSLRFESLQQFPI